jgi:hypothetical protein
MGGNANLGVVFKLTLDKGQWKKAVVHSFAPPPDGGNPGYGLIHDKAGRFCGVTPVGGTEGAGVVFEITPLGDNDNHDQVMALPLFVFTHFRVFL